MLLDRVERCVVRRSDANYAACVRLCQSAKRLGNCAAYIIRQNLFQGKPFLNQLDLDNRLREDYATDYRDMPSAASAQRQGQMIRDQFKSFFAASQEFKANPDKFQGKPHLPRYSNKFRTFVVGRNGYKIENGMLTITGAKRFGFEPIKITCCSNQKFNSKVSDTVCGDLRVCPKGNSFVIEITYHKEVSAKAVLLNQDHALAIDLGIDNLAACVSTELGVPPLLIKGGVLKSINQWWNKRASELQSLGKYGHLADIAFKRNNQISDLLHKAAHAVIEYCLAYDIGTIIVGLNPDWKQRVNMGTKNNQKFVQIPHKGFINKLCSKAEEQGIKVIVREESYTSKASNLDFDYLPPYYQKGLRPKFSGRRIQRGLYKTKDGKLINADIQGAIGIARKELGDEWLRSFLANGGRVDRPVVIRNLHSKLDCAALLKKGRRALETPCVSMG